MRCVKLVSATLHQIFLADQSPEEHDPPEIEFMVVALDLLSGLVQGMGQLVEPLVATSDPPLLSLLAVCIHVSNLLDIQQTALTLHVPSGPRDRSSTSDVRPHRRPRHRVL